MSGFRRGWNSQKSDAYNEPISADDASHDEAAAEAEVCDPPGMYLSGQRWQAALH